MKKFLKVIGILFLIGLAIELSPLFAIIAFGYGGYNLYKYFKYQDSYEKDKIEYRNLSLGSFAAVIVLAVIANMNANNKAEMTKQKELRAQQKQEQSIAEESDKQKQLEDKEAELKAKEEELAKKEKELDQKDNDANNTEKENQSEVVAKEEPAKDINNIFEVATITDVTDGDTVTVGIYGTGYKTRLIGVDTPETVHPSKPVEFMGKEASDFTKEQLQDKKIWLEKDVSDTDRYDRLLRYIWIEEPSDIENPTYEDVRDKMFNGILVRDGYANISTFPPDVKYQDYFARIEQEAREKGVGLWDEQAAAAYVVPQATTQANNNGAWKETNNPSQNNGMIKGNVNSGIYHVPGGASYNKVAEHNTVYFNSEEEAQAAGYRRAKR
ncbi:MAG: thermonuclease family protein [Anaerococcus sp.]|nr:thermonuclease family protein [Anaerococcus sp.]